MLIDETNLLSEGGLPNNLTAIDKTIIFGNAADVKAYAPQKNIDSIEINIKELQDENFLLQVFLSY